LISDPVRVTCTTLFNEEHWSGVKNEWLKESFNNQSNQAIIVLLYRNSIYNNVGCNKHLFVCFYLVFS
jgi:hypothetical protein